MLLPFAAHAQVIFTDGFEDLNDKSAARFLDQASFGGRVQDIARVRQLGYAGWLEQQFTAAAQTGQAVAHCTRTFGQWL